MWLHKSTIEHKTIKSKLLKENGKLYVDVRGQSCPNFIISIQRALEKIEPGVEANLLLTYKPGNADIRILCAARRILVISMTNDNGIWEIVVKKPVQPDEIEKAEIAYSKFIGGMKVNNVRDTQDNEQHKQSNRKQ